MTLNEAQKNQVRLHFLLLDEDSDGKIEVSQLGSFLRAAGLYPTDAEVQGITGVVDPDGTGQVTEERALEAVESLWPRRTSAEELREAFKVLDEDSDGYLTATDLRHILVNLGLKLSQEEADKVIAMVDKDDESFINIDDLITLLMTPKPLR
ncbi:calmodulin [Angomonas deanei]|uniref:EF-hand domain pair/EF-hand domain containing protein, putative n=1 Tax=Angomonas deanei TaxID=59799 RepID=S9UN09_9TRYP|nr:calmodulin [Angomonas deanei]EPY32237.1 calmodulin [Angomonas deanei]EPY40774.1 calmodulin [Angomonas deanei]CAD2220885.1 EF-hand domain pair/EF-hand domain containing protein, putative [Angomonas deanei]|eukprot:EPY25972.1 calmodulin [Angomonas deanei]